MLGGLVRVVVGTSDSDGEDVGGGGLDAEAAEGVCYLRCGEVSGTFEEVRVDEL